MTLNEFLDWMDEVRPSPWSHEQKALWVNDLESSLFSRILLAPAGSWQTRTAAKNGDEPLLLGDEWRKLYAAYVGAMMDYTAGENAAYANSMALYNGYLAELGAWYAETFDPARRGPVWMTLPAARWDALREEGAFLGSIPAGAAVLGAEFRVTEAFDGGGSLCLTTGSGELLACCDPAAGGTKRVWAMTMPGERESVWLLYTGAECAAGTASVRLLLQPAAGCRTTLTVAAGSGGATGRPGRDGKSAYAYAREGGYEGTEAEFSQKLARELPETLVLYTPQTLTEEQKLQARVNIGVPEETYTATETLQTVFVANDHSGLGAGIDKRDYSYTPQDIAAQGYPSYAGMIARGCTLDGGLLRVEYDPEALGAGTLQIGLYLFDGEGKPYKHTGYGDGSGSVWFGDEDTGFAGELYEPTYVDPAPADNPGIVNAGYSFGVLKGPFTTRLPAGCTGMVYVRCVSYPCGNFADYKALCGWLAEGGISFTVEKTVEKSAAFLPRRMGAEHANGRLVTDENGNVTVQAGEETIPAYWQSHLDEKIRTIQAHQAAGGRDCFSFGVVTDVHYSENKGKRSPRLAKYILDACDIKYLLCLGDMQTQAAVGDEDTIHAEWQGIRKMFAPLKDRTLMTLGNHDGAWGQLDSDSDGAVDAYYGYNLTPAKLYEYVFRTVGTVPGVHFDESGNGFYVDDPAGHVRYIILNTSCTAYAENDDGTAKYNYMTYQRIGQAQVDMVVEALQTVPDADWSVVIGSHIPLSADFADNYVGDRGALMTILEGYQNKASGVSASWEEADMGWAVEKVDFSAAKGSIIGAFAGHMHEDDANTDHGFPIVLTACDCLPAGTTLHQAGTTTEQSFDIFTVNRKTGVIYATKIGYGGDRVIQSGREA